VNGYGDWTRPVPDSMKKYGCRAEEIMKLDGNDFEEEHGILHLP
jgi:hypothetical protein